MAGNAMRRISLRNLAAHKVRLALTVLSVVLGTAFVAGSFVFTDTLQKTFNGIFENTAQGVDVRVSAKSEDSAGVPDSLIPQLESAANVSRVVPAVGMPIVMLNGQGKVVQGGGAPIIGLSYRPDDQSLGDKPVFSAGTAPQQSGQIAINSSGAKRADLHVGDTTKVITARSLGAIDVTVSGIYDTTAGNTGGYTGVYFTAQQATALFTDGSHVGYIDIAGNGVSANTLKSEISALLPDYKVQTGDDVRKETQQQVSSALSFINYILLAFGAIALLVGTFIIYNTFSMLVASRARELALLRAIGASRGQVRRAVVGEAIVVAILGSLIGVAGGVGLAYGLRALLNAFDIGLPSGPLQILPHTFAWSVGLGLVVTVLSAYAPARRASTIAPVAAMREEFASVGTSLRLRTIIGSVVTLVGALLIGLGQRNTGGSAAATVGGGAALAILGILMASPALSQPIIAVLGVVTRPFGAVGAMARNNAVRNPRRTAATAFALTLGLILVATVSVIGASAKASINSLVDNGVRADYILTSSGNIGVPYGVPKAVASVSGIDTTVAIQDLKATVKDATAKDGSAASGSLNGVLDVHMNSGSANLTDAGVLVSETTASTNNWQLGSQITVENADKVSRTLAVTGVYRDNDLLGDYVVNETSYEALTPASRLSDDVVLIKAAPNADLTALRADLEKATNSFYVVQVQDREEFKGSIASQINTLLGIIYGLLALAVVIAILGIINTLALSVVERRREIGMLRAVGMQRAQVRRTIYSESFLIAVFGALVGVAMGLIFGWALVRTLADQGLGTFAVPWTQVIVMLVASGVVGVLAALWPAVRAARTSPLAAIADV